MPYHHHLIAAALVAVFVAGCAGVTNMAYEDTWYVTPKPGSRVEVQETLALGGGARISLQNGKVMRWGDVYKLKPYCQFRVMRSSGQLDEPLRINPDTFIVEQVYRRKDVVSLEGVQYAFADGEDFNNSPSQRSMSTYLELSSEAQPDVYRLVCSRWDDPFDRNHLTISEIRQSLGDLVRLVLN